MEIRELHERPAVSIRMSTRVEKLPEIMGKSFGEIMQYLASKGVQPAGPPYAMYHNMDMSNLDVEMGFPLAESIEGDGQVNPSKLPDGRAGVAVHLGPYETIEQTYKKLAEYLGRHGLEMESFMYEFYLNDPGEVAPEEIRTEIYLPIKG